ncbi:MAG TPA: thermonuclease family protein [Aestuariivirga sp.]|nr:thermonuclease family protein [Aestuariivirga sp.]
MSDRRRPTRPFHKSVFDGLVFLAVLAVFVFALNRTGFIAPQTGNFIAVDGDSLRQADQDFRLHGIDAAELHQYCVTNGRQYPCGQEAKRALGQLVRGKKLACLTLDGDRYGRNVVQCRAGDLDINAEMVRLGWAIAYVKHSTAYMDEEADARRNKRGLWQGTFESPEKWRRRNRNSLTQNDPAD